MNDERNEEIDRLLRQGLSRRDIARRLGISPTRVQQLVGSGRMGVLMTVTEQAVELRSPGTTPTHLAERVRRALALAKVDVIEEPARARSATPVEELGSGDQRA